MKSYIKKHILGAYVVLFASHAFGSIKKKEESSEIGKKIETKTKTETEDEQEKKDIKYYEIKEDDHSLIIRVVIRHPSSGKVFFHCESINLRGDEKRMAIISLDQFKYATKYSLPRLLEYGQGDEGLLIILYGVRQVRIIPLPKKYCTQVTCNKDGTWTITLQKHNKRKRKLSMKMIGRKKQHYSVLTVYGPTKPNEQNKLMFGKTLDFY